MPVASRLRYLYLAYLSRPTGERAIYREIRRLKPRTIVEIGLTGGLRRTERMIAVAQRYAAGGTTVQYTGIDRFEDQPDGQPAVTLMSAYKHLRPLGVRLRLEPGEPHWALQRAANSLTGTDLLLIGAGHAAEHLAEAWFYLPRMLHDKTLVLVEERKADGQTRFTAKTPADIRRLAASDRPLRRAA